jgi:hypothetical protein
LKATAPVVTIETDPSAVQKVNIQDKFSLTASVYSTVSSCVATWKVEESWKLSLSSVQTVGPISTTVQSGVVASLSLTLPAGVMQGRESYTFSLTCGKSATSIVVKTNGAPYGGSISIDPSTGVELTTLFLSSTSLWIDEDLPLSYQFGFSSGSHELVIRSRSELTYSSATLPAGSAQEDYSLNVSVIVFDTLSSSSLMQKYVSVVPMTETELESTVMSSFHNVTAATLSVDELTKLISVSSAALNRVDCSKAPDCSAFNRESCAKVSNTCGACLSGHVGQSGDQNSQCLSVDTLSFSTNSTTTVIDKRCPQDCSGHGTCSFYSTISANYEKTLSCSILSSSCVATCSCDKGYASSSCSMTEEQIAAQQSIRKAMLDGLSMIVATATTTASTSSETFGREMIDETSALNAISSISSIVRSADDLSDESAAALMSLVGSILDKIDTSTLSSSSVTGLASVLSSIDTLMDFQKVSAVGGSADRRRLSETSSQSVSTLLSLQSFSQVLLAAKDTNEGPSEFMEDNFRLTGQVFDINSDAHMVLPLSDIDKMSDAVPCSVSGKLSSTDDVAKEMSLQAIQVTPSAFANGNATLMSVLQSSVLMVKASDNIGFVLLTIPYSETSTAVATLTSADTPIETHDVECKSGLVENHQVACLTDISTVPAKCVGQAGILTVKCPRRKPTPVCATLNVNGQLESDDSTVCAVVGQSPTSVTCNCSFNIMRGFDRMRKLESVEEGLQKSGFISTGLMIKYIAEEFGTTMSLADDVSMSTASDTTIVLVMFGLFWSGGFLVLLLIWRRKRRCEDKAKSIKKLIEKNVRRPGLLGGIDIENKKVAVAYQPIDSHDHDFHEEEKKRLQIAERLLQYITSALPAVYKTSSSFLFKIKDELVHNHLCFNILFGAHEGAKPWLIGLFELMTLQTMMMFMLAVLYDLQGPDDDGSCLLKADASSCESRKSILDSQQTYCSWEVVTTPSGTSSSNVFTTGSSDSPVAFHCVYNPVEFTPLLVTYVAAITSICTALIGKPLTKLFEILSAPTDEFIKASVVSTAFLKLQKQVVYVARRASAVAVQMRNAIVPVQTVSVVSEGEIISHAKYVPQATERAYKNARASMDMLGPALQHMVTKRLAYDHERKAKRRDVTKTPTFAPTTSVR